MPKISKQVKRLKGNGYPINDILDIIGSDDNTHTIVYTSPLFQPYSATFSEKFAFVGPSIRPATEEVEKKRDKLIYISMGTVNNNMMPFYKSCISALKDSEYQVIMSVGSLVDLKSFGKLPENISVYSYVDQIAVLEKADVFVSHCGMNSASESLYFEVPLVMLPQTSEQKGVAEQILRLGAGIMPDKMKGTSVLNAINKILSDNKYKENAKKISDEKELYIDKFKCVIQNY